ncbi:MULTISPECIES: hypothetical protein [unclassified Pseudomonas]|uniref:hypothetical protein n=1 Tax=unclassified Pseudomonas TaxID=196821 RepID=UPI000CD29FD7|nr:MULTISPECIES: hypothetical protein [unclassified Pseudomonas]POA31028.1 hypothetical protein C1891_25065 [Pseudomonas sp. GW456-12-1-14-TSB6]
MFTTEIEKLGGTVTFDDISQLDQSADISIILDELKEDLFQAALPFQQIIDIGWYPEFSEQGAFKVSLISNFNWEKPIYSEKAKDWTELKNAIKNTLKKVKTE